VALAMMMCPSALFDLSRANGFVASQQYWSSDV
jgi:hypothetical protein